MRTARQPRRRNTKKRNATTESILYRTSRARITWHAWALNAGGVHGSLRRQGDSAVFAPPLTAGWRRTEADGRFISALCTRRRQKLQMCAAGRQQRRARTSILGWHLAVKWWYMLSQGSFMPPPRAVDALPLPLAPSQRTPTQYALLSSSARSSAVSMFKGDLPIASHMS